MDQHHVETFWLLRWRHWRYGRDPKVIKSMINMTWSHRDRTENVFPYFWKTPYPLFCDISILTAVTSSNVPSSIHNSFIIVFSYYANICPIYKLQLHQYWFGKNKWYQQQIQQYHNTTFEYFNNGDCQWTLEHFQINIIVWDMYWTRATTIPSTHAVLSWHQTTRSYE